MRWTALLIAAPNNRIMALHAPGQEAVHLIKTQNPFSAKATAEKVAALL